MLDKKDMGALLKADMNRAEEDLRRYAQKLADDFYEAWGLPVTDIVVEVREPVQVLGAQPRPTAVTRAEIQIRI